MMTKYMQVLPKSIQHTKLVLEHLEAGDDFKDRFYKFMRPLLIKGVPSMINDFRILYKQEGKSKIIGDLLHQLCTNMEEEMVLMKEDEEEQDPTVQFWLYFFLSQHYWILGEVEEALKWINKAIEHTPTVMDIYTLKAKIMQLAGDRREAESLTNEARTLDKADRHLNAINSKYQLKIDEVKNAHDTMGPFSKEDENGQLNVHEMQTMWFEIECGKAHYRLKDYRKSLKMFSYINLHLETMLDDCYDFHHYSFRKVTVNHYLQMIEWQDNAFRGKWPIRCCHGVLNTLSKIQKISPSEEEASKQFEEHKQTEEYKKWEKEFDDRDDDDMVRNDPDPEGWKAYIDAIRDPVKVAVELATKVAPMNATCASTQAKCLNWFIKADKPEEALSCISNLLTHSPKHHKTIGAINRFKKYSSGLKLEGEIKEKYSTFEGTLLKNHKGSDAVAKSMEHTHELIKIDSPKDAEKLAISALEKDSESRRKVTVAENTSRLLAKKNGSAPAEYNKKAQSLFPYSTFFDGPKASKPKKEEKEEEK